MMKKTKKQRLERAGWTVSDAQELLGLTDAENALIEMKQKLMRLVKDTRGARNMTQTALADLLHSSQSRMAKLENGSIDVSLDLIVRALFAMGVTNSELSKVIRAPLRKIKSLD